MKTTSNCPYHRFTATIAHFFGCMAAMAIPVTLFCSQSTAPEHHEYIDSTTSAQYPDFITANSDYFITRIGSVPQVDSDSFRLEITGLVKTPRSFSQSELMALPQKKVPLTVECIGNYPNDDLIGTAVWTGFSLYDLLATLGIDSGATGVRYRCADGYYASSTIGQIRTNGVVGAYLMNGETLPPEQGFPLRMLSPGFYGVKQPMWVVAIEVTDQPLADYWSDRGWDVSPPMAIDSKIFFPTDGDRLKPGDTLFVGGAAFGGKRVAGVEVTTDSGTSWHKAQIVKSMEVDNVWVFWLVKFVPAQSGYLQIRSRATDISGNSQPQTDETGDDGRNGWPGVSISVVE